ncbi:dual specificity protein phosphatase family protein [Candidatus Bathyarchaeota archaeon]|nr:dual specificity protein phosphatase family protein [Candidatus Bathyarchaeota archaeon]
MITETLDLAIGGIKARLLKYMGLAGLLFNANMITNNIWVGGLNSPRTIISEGFDTVIDLREEDAGSYQSILKKHGIEYFNIKIPDGMGAPPDVLFEITKIIMERVNDGKKILIHCNLGRGRSMLVAAAYLVSKGLKPNEAINKIKSIRSVSFLNTQQREALYEFAKAIKEC